MDEKETLHHYLRVRRDNLLGKLDGLGEYDVRRPLTPTGTNLLGLVKHVASMELGYFGEVFERPSGRHLPWLDDDASPDADLWVTAEESRDSIVELHHFAAAHSDATIEALPADAPGRCHGGRRSGVTSPCIRLWSTWCVNGPTTWVTQTSCGNSSTAPPASVRATRT